MAKALSSEQQAQYDLGCEALRMGGFKVTPCRRYVLQTLIGQRGPHSVQSIMDTAPASAHLDQSTVYRTLESFQELGMIRLVPMASSRQTYYEWSNHGQHYHLVCQKCRKVLHLDIFDRDDLNRRVATLGGFAEVDHHLDFFGTCKDCAPLS